MPKVNKNKEIIIEKISTQDGEITVNLNLSITLDGGQIQVNAQALPVEEQKKVEEQDPEFIPDEAFDLEIPVLTGFGHSIKK